MAKKKIEENTISTDNLAERIRAEINSRFKVDICKTGQSVLDRKIQILNWTPSLDLILGGGVPEGTWISISGKPKTGKSTYLLSLGAKAQKMGKILFYLDAEGRFKKMNITGVKGLDISPDKFVLIQSTENKILSTQDYLNITDNIIKTVPGAFIIIDSVSALADEKELTGGLGTQTRGHNQHVITQFIQNIGQLVSPTNCILAGVVHLIANTSGMGSPTVEKAANRWIYQADIQLRIKHIDIWRSGQADTAKAIGQILHWECRTSALGKPYQICDSYLRYGIGPDITYEIIQMALACGLIEQAGAWYNMIFMPEPQKVQGAEKVWAMLEEQPKLMTLLEEKLKAYSDNLTSSIEE